MNIIENPDDMEEASNSSEQNDRPPKEESNTCHQKSDEPIANNSASFEDSTIAPEPALNEGKQDTPEVVEHSSVLSALLIALHAIDFYEQADLAAGESLKRHHYVIMVIDAVMETAKKYSFALSIVNGFVYAFNGAYWKEIQKQELQHFLGKASELLGVEKFIARYHVFHSELLKQFSSSAYLPKQQRQYDEVLINLKNGTFMITADEQVLRPFNRHDFLTYQLPFNYDVQAKAPQFEQYLSRVLPDKEQQLILAEFIGYVFVRQKTLKLEKSLILYGGGANGKSVFFEIITALLGPENVSNYSLQSLTDSKGYERAMLKNKLVNYASEISPNLEVTLFKQMVSGEPVQARLPYAPPFILEDYAKLIFNTNTLPRDVEQTEAFFRRFLILHFNVTIPEDERDPLLASKIISQELSGVFNWILHGLQRLLLQKKFTHSQVVENTLKQYRQQSDTVHLFLEDEGYIPDTKGETALKTIYSGYKHYCDESGHRACSMRAFSDRLRNLGYELSRKKQGYVVNIKKNSSY